jgi:hypothetical protein
VLGRATPAALVIAAALADSFGAHGLAFYVLLLAVPVAAVEALRRLEDRVGAGLSGVSLALILLTCALRAPSAEEATVPAAARSALMACVALVCVEALVALAAELRRRREPVPAA